MTAKRVLMDGVIRSSRVSRQGRERNRLWQRNMAHSLHCFEILACGFSVLELELPSGRGFRIQTGWRWVARETGVFYAVLPLPAASNFRWLHIDDPTYLKTGYLSQVQSARLSLVRR